MRKTRSKGDSRICFSKQRASSKWIVLPIDIRSEEVAALLTLGSKFTSAFLKKTSESCRGGQHLDNTVSAPNRNSMSECSSIRIAASIFHFVGNKLAVGLSAGPSLRCSPLHMGHTPFASNKCATTHL